MADFVNDNSGDFTSDAGETAAPNKLRLETAKEMSGAKPQPAEASTNSTSTQPKDVPEDPNRAIKAGPNTAVAQPLQPEAAKGHTTDAAATPQKPVVQDFPSAQSKSAQTAQAPDTAPSASQEIRKTDGGAAPLKTEIGKTAPAQRIEQQPAQQTPPLSSEKATGTATRPSVDSEKSDSVPTTAQLNNPQAASNRETGRASENQSPLAVANAHTEGLKPQDRTTDASAPPVKAPVTERQSSGPPGSSDTGSTPPSKRESSGSGVESSKAKSPQDDSPRTDSSKTDSPKTDSPRTDSPRTDSPRTDSSKTDSPKTDSPKTDSPKTDSPRTDSPRADSSKTDSPRTDSPRADSPKADPTRSDSSVSGSSSTPDKHMHADSISDAHPPSEKATPAGRSDDAHPLSTASTGGDTRQVATTKGPDIPNGRASEQTIKTAELNDNAIQQPHKLFENKPDVASSFGLIESKMDNRPILPNTAKEEIGRIADVRTTANECIVTTISNKGKQEIDIAERGTQSSILTVLQLIEQRVYRPIAERFTSLVDFVSNFKQPDAQKFQQILSRTEDANYKRGDEIRDLAKLVTNLMNRAREIIDRNDPIQRAILIINQWRQSFESKHERLESRRKLDSDYEASVSKFTEMLRQTVENTKPMQIPKDASTPEEIDALVNNRFRETISETDEQTKTNDRTQISGPDNNTVTRQSCTAKSGDTMSTIARDYLNDPNLAALICKLNPAICRPGETNKLLAPGTSVALPTQSELRSYKIENEFEMAYR